MKHLYQKTHFDELIKGERYFIRHGHYQWVTGKFLHYEGDEYNFAIFHNLKKNTSWQYRGIKWCLDSTDLYYKIIPHEMYKNKLKDKYDAKVLKIILKRIVNEDFEW
jgi:hypothetical protein